jgi:hypothetical protein
MLKEELRVLKESRNTYNEQSNENIYNKNEILNEFNEKILELKNDNTIRKFRLYYHTYYI